MPHTFRSHVAWKNFHDKATDYRAWMARKKLEGPKRTNKPRQFANCTCGHHMGGFTGRPRGLECVKCHKRYWIYADGTMKERARYDR